MTSKSLGIFVPSIWLLQRLPIARKFFLIMLVFTLPMAYLSWNSVMEKNQQIRFHQTQLQGLSILHSAEQAFDNILAIRELAYAESQGFQLTSTDVPQSTTSLDESLKKMNSIGSQASQEQFLEINRLWTTVRAGDDSPLQVHNQYASLSQQYRQYLHSLAEDYYILLGSDISSYQLSHVRVDLIPYAIDLVSAIQGLGSGIIAHGNFTPESFIKLSYYSGELDNTIKRLQRAFSSLNHTTLDPTFTTTKLKSMREFLRYTHANVIDPDSFQVRARDFFDHGSELLAQLHQLQDATSQTLQNRLAHTRAEQMQFRNEIIFISTAIILVVLYLFAGFYVSMKHGIGEINDTLAYVAKGELGQRAEVHSDDEIRSIAENLNHMTEQLTELVQIAYSKTPEQI